MRIAVWHNLPSGGGKRALYYHVRGLVERGHHVEIWCPPTADLDFLPLSDFAREHVVALDRSFLRNPIASVDRSARAIAAMNEHCRACAEQIDSRNFDVLMSNSCQDFATTAIARFVRIPTVLYLQEPFRQLYEAQSRPFWAARPRGSTKLWRPSTWVEAARDWVTFRNARVRVREEVENAAAFTKILVNSYFSRESVRRAYGLEAEVCYLGIDTELFTDRHLPRTRNIISVGAFSAHKNVRAIIEAVAALPAPRPPVTWISNSTPESRFLEAMNDLAKERDVVLDVQVRVSDEELVRRLNEAMVMLYAPQLEPFGYAPLEAGACGLAVVAVREGGVRETIRDGENGMLVDGDPNAMAAAVGSLLEDGGSRVQRLGSRAREIVLREWTLAAATERLEEKLRTSVSSIS